MNKGFLRLHNHCPWLSVVSSIICLCGAAWLSAGSACLAATFTADTFISYTNFTYDGQEIVVTNCTLTVDGAHGFLDVHLLNGGVLTHSAVTNAALATNLIFTAGEAHVLSSANAALLNQPYVLTGTVVVTDPSGSNIYAAGTDYMLQAAPPYTAIVLLPGSAIPDGSTNLASYSSLGATIYAGLNLSVTNNVEIESGGAIDVAGKGYGPGSGPGAGATQLTNFPYSYYAGSGGGHSGFGGNSSSLAPGGLAYDSCLTPTNSGSGGGAGNGVGGGGGGLVTLAIGGLLRVDGRISADGAGGFNPQSGGGAGGSLWLSAQSISGAGLISAAGGAGEPVDGGGGGGGRIAIYWGGNGEVAGSNVFTGVVSAQGGAGATAGGAGTVYSDDSRDNSPPQLLADNGGQSGTNTLLSESGAFDLIIRGGAAVQPAVNMNLNSLTIRSNSSLAWAALQTQTVSVLSNATIDPGGEIKADGKGYPAGAGTGAGHSILVSNVLTGGGASYGGVGGPSAYGAPSGIAYGAIDQPTAWGSGGGNGNSPKAVGGTGGGAVRLTVGGILTLNGGISANGLAGSGAGTGGGSGGSVWLTAGSILGTGFVSANAGAGDLPFGGGGGGGRVAINYSTNLFTGSATAYGAPGMTNGGAGSIYWHGPGTVLPQVIVDNGGLTGASNTVVSVPGNACDLTVRGQAAAVTSSLSLGNLFIGSNSWISAVSSQIPFVFTVSNNATVQAGGGISLDGLGSPAMSGLGAGRTISTPTYGLVGSGGGFGGFGGAGVSNSFGGTTYGSITAPTTSGSGGGNGNGNSPYSLGGNGGGALQLTVSNLLVLDGRITANGGTGIGQNSGGGSGGSLWLTAGSISGAGLISANGGNGDLPYGGGGAGGRVALFYKFYTFTGVIAAHGGAGANYGGAGTVFLESQAAGQFALPLLTIDNGGQSATNTPLAVVPACDLTISGGAAASAGTAPSAIRNLLITSNSWLLCTNLSPTTLNVTNATIQAGGGILLDGYGFSAATGNGAGRTVSGQFGTAGSGAGFGGNGGASVLGTGGAAYGQITEPSFAGSGGGNGTGNGQSGGAGGGGLRINLTGILALGGKISANGKAAPGLAGGGGSGGSIWLVVGTLTGAGGISVNGGAGDLPYGGGGAGGRILISYLTNQFTGQISASGGVGASPGGAGTICLTATRTASSQIIVDNAGVRSGTNTALGQLPVNTDLTISGGAIANLLSGSLRSLVIASNSSLAFSNSVIGDSGTLTISSNATIQAGGFLTADGAGPTGGSGTGAGHSLTSAYGTSGSGGGYGGNGGASAFGAAGGLFYGSLTTPTDLGSGGGNTTGTFPLNLGGAGGGAARLTVNGILAVDGRLSADGLAGVGVSSGGGSGGSLYLTVGTIRGAGTISASGGSGDPPYGGGGAGGRIAIYYATNQFIGATSAHGGSGGMAGGAGTFYLASTKGGNNLLQIIVDNAGQNGTNTPLSVPSGVNLSISGTAVLTPTSLSSLATLSIASNSWLAYSNNQGPLTVTGAATIQRGGGISLNNAGYGPGAGPGAGGFISNQSYGPSGGGGGHGGLGAASTPGALGGNAYGSILQPAELGSGGGGAGTSAAGGPGGGELQFTVQGKLQLDGVIAANGGDFISEGGGGGSGGSVWLTVGTLAGGGAISANGGDGDYSQGGGGAGGRVAIYSSTNQFQGAVTAWGGLGASFGGAGTIYSKINSAPVGQLVVDNGGSAGTNTPIVSTNSFGLTVIGGAVVNPAAGPLVFSSLLVDSGGSLTHLNTESNLDVTVLTNATIGPEGAIDVDDKGYAGSNGGPGAGQMTNSFSGSGAGYGGPGGAGISGIAGGATYGSSTQPTDLGSRGGVFPISPAFCQGGGAVRLQVGGTLALNGIVSANGNAALLEGAGGGAGGSVWVTARKFGGNGMIFANGGPGDPDQGGGGGGGRIAIYSLSNNFAGVLGAQGGGGASPGGNGSIYVVTNIPLPQVIAQSPSGSIESAVSNVDLTFGSPMDFTSASPADFSLVTPNGPLTSNSFTTVAINLNTVRFGFPAQSELGLYQLQAGPQISDIYGQAMSAAYLGSFEIVPPLISGRVVDTNGSGVPFLTLQVTSNAFPILTDGSGNYSLEVFPGWTGTVTPEYAGRIFIPQSRSFTNVSSDMTNQNFIMATSAALALTSQTLGTNLNLSWFGLNGVSYQVLWSSNLVNWVPYDAPVTGTNGPASLAIPIDVTSPTDFFRFRAGY